MRKLRSMPVTMLATALAFSACAPAPSPSPVAIVPTVPAPTPTPGILPPTYTVRRGEVLEQLRLSGRVAAELDQDVYATTSGFVKTLYVQRGDLVTAGQILAELDPGELPSQLEQAQASLRAAENQAASNRRQRQFAIDSARLQLTAAQDNLARLQQGASPEETALALDKIDRARIALADTRNRTSAAKTNAEFARSNAGDGVRAAQEAYSATVWANGSKPLEELDPQARLRQEQAQRNLESAERALASAQVAYDLAVQNEITSIQLAERDVAAAEQAYQELLAPPDYFELRAAERALQQARTNLAQAQASAEDPMGNSQIEQYKLSLAEIEGQIAAGKVYAPFDGVVGELGVQPGDQMEAYAPMMNIIAPNRLVIVVAEIAAADLNRIAPGQAVQVSLQRYPEAAIAGRVERLPSDEASPGSLVRPDPLLRISFEPGERELTIGDIAELSLTFDQVSDALWLPPQAIFEFDQRSFVLVQEGGQQRQVDVQVGITTPERVQILAGLNEGDVVVGPLDLTQ